jgi:hypothetical protein
MSSILFQTTVKLVPANSMLQHTVIIHTTFILSNVLYILYCVSVQLHVHIPIIFTFLHLDTYPLTNCHLQKQLKGF